MSNYFFGRETSEILGGAPKYFYGLKRQNKDQ